MAKDSQPRGLCLPSHFPLRGAPMALHGAISSAAAFAKACEEVDAEEEERLLAALAHTIARYFFPEDEAAEAVARSSADKESLNGPSSPPPVEQRKESEHRDLLYEAARQVLRLRRLADLRRGQSLYPARGIIGPARKPALGAPGNVGFYAFDPVRSTQRLQAAHFYHLKQQQSMKQPAAAAAAWGRQSTATGGGVGCTDRGRRPLDLPPPAWPALPQPAAMFLNTSSPRKESSGTGVFLPRVANNNKKLEPKRKSADAGIAARSSAVPSNPKNDHFRAQSPPLPPAAAAAAAQDIVLPQEWTY